MYLDIECGERPSPEIKDLDMRQAQRLEEPLILRLPVGILICSQRVSDTVQRVDDGTSEIIHWVCFVLIPSHMMRLIDASVYGRISHGPVWRLVIHLSSKEPSLTFGATGQHFLEASKVVSDGSITVFGRNESHSLFSHLEVAL